MHRVEIAPLVSELCCYALAPVLGFAVVLMLWLGAWWTAAAALGTIVLDAVYLVKLRRVRTSAAEWERHVGR